MSFLQKKKDFLVNRNEGDFFLLYFNFVERIVKFFKKQIEEKRYRFHGSIKLTCIGKLPRNSELFSVPQRFIQMISHPTHSITLLEILESSNEIFEVNFSSFLCTTGKG